MASGQERKELEETVVPGGTGGKSLQAQEHLAEGRQRGGETRKQQLGHEGYQELGKKGGLSTNDKAGGERAADEGRHRGGEERREQLGTEGYKEMSHCGGETRKQQMETEGYQHMGRKGGLSTMNKSGEERAAEEGIDVDESKYKTRS